MSRRSSSQSPQSTFAGFEAPRPTDRLFYALLPDEDTAARIAALARSLHDEHALQGRRLQATRLHVTLHHLGDHAGLPDDVVAKARDAAAAVAMPAFGIAFDSVSSFTGRPRNRPLVLRGTMGVVQAVAFQTTLGERMAVAGLGRWIERNFTPHLTLLYDDRSVAPQTIEPIAWTVREFVLVHSLLGRTEHRILGRWPLRG